MQKRAGAQAVEHPPVKIWIIRPILHRSCICSLCYFSFKQMSTTGSSKGVVCAILSAGKYMQKIPSCLRERVACAV